MGARNEQVDAYIANAAECTRPVLEKIRATVHKACPQIEETIKWNVPWFVYKGPLLGMAAFTSHVSFGFWKGKLMEDPHGLLAPKPNTCSVKAATVRDLPPQKVLVQYIKEAVKLNEQDVKLPRRTGAAAKAPAMPRDLADALKKNAKAKKVFEAFPPSAQRDYVYWIKGAKRDETREKRLATTIEWLEQGKQRNWKYSKR